MDLGDPQAPKSQPPQDFWRKAPFALGGAGQPVLAGRARQEVRPPLHRRGGDPEKGHRRKKNLTATKRPACFPGVSLFSGWIPFFHERAT